MDVLAGEERYALHPLTRAFVRDELLADANVARETGMRFARYWADYAEQYGGSGRNYMTFDRLESEWPNLDAALEWTWNTASVRDGLKNKDAARILIDLVRSAERFLRYSGRWNEHLQLNILAYEAAQALGEWNAAGWCARDAAWTHYYRGQPDEASVWADRCAKAWEINPSRHRESIIIKLQGVIAKERHDYATAERHFQLALAIRRGTGDEDGIAIMLNDLGELAYERGNYEDAEEYFTQALEIDKSTDRKIGVATRYGNLGKVALKRELWREGQKWFDAEFSLAQEIGRTNLIAEAQYGLARVHEAEGRADLALPLAQDALKIYERLQHKDLAAVRELVERLKGKV